MKRLTLRRKYVNRDREREREIRKRKEEKKNLYGKGKEERMQNGRKKKVFLVLVPSYRDGG